MSDHRAIPPAEQDLQYFRSPGNRRVRKRRWARVGVKWTTIALVHAGIVGLLLWSGSRFIGRLVTSPRFALDRVVITGASRTTEPEIRRALAGAYGGNVLRVDLEDVGRRIEALPWIDRVSVRRVLPRGLEVAVTERAPRARFALADAMVVVDATGRVLGTVSGDDASDLPVIRGLGTPGTPEFERAARRAVACLDRLRATQPAWYPELAEIDVSRPEAIAALTTAPGPKILLDPEAVERNLEHFLALSEDIRTQIGPAEIVDLRWRDRIAIVPVPEEPAEPEPAQEGGES